MSRMDELITDMRRITFGEKLKRQAALDLVNIGWARELPDGRVLLTREGSRRLDCQTTGYLVIAGIVEEEDK